MDPAELSHIEFEEDRVRPRRVGSSGMARWIVEHSGGLVPDERRARYVTAVVIVGALVVMFLLLRESGTYVKRGGPGPSADEVEGYRAIQPF